MVDVYFCNNYNDKRRAAVQILYKYAGDYPIWDLLEFTGIERCSCPGCSGETCDNCPLKNCLLLKEYLAGNLEAFKAITLTEEINSVKTPCIITVTENAGGDPEITYTSVDHALLNTLGGC